MQKNIRYGDFVSAATVRQRRISFNHLTPKLEYDSTGQSIPYRPQPLKLSAYSLSKLLWHYIKIRLNEQVIAVLPLVVYLIFIQVVVLRLGVTNPISIAAGVMGVIIGLMLFMEGLKRGLMPFGEHIGDALPRKVALYQVLLVVFVLGVGVTFAEPAIGALKTVGSIVSAERAPLLYMMLNQWSDVLILTVGIGVGLAAVLASLRLIRNWSLKPLIYITLIPLLGLTVMFSLNEHLSSIVGLAWDCGAVTTGPVTVPLVLAFGVGVAAATSKSTEPSGFGIVTLASLFPILGVLLLGLYVYETTPEILHQAESINIVTTPATEWYATSPGQEILMGIRAIVPLIIFLFLVLRLLLRDSLSNWGIISYGLILSVLGMIVFNLGLSYGLSALGQQSGSNIPGLFKTVTGIIHFPVIGWEALGIAFTFLFAWFLGFGATFAEPALHAMGMTVEDLTQGAFKKRLLILAVSIGVAFGIGLGVLKLILGFPLYYILLPGYTLALIMTVIVGEEYVNIAWDSAGVTTGPVTVPLVLAMGLGLGNATNAIEGFGILALASIGPIITVLATGLWIEWQIQRSHRYA